MSWQDIMRRVLPPVGILQPHTTSAYGAIRKQGTSPHVGIDANYNVGQTGINLTHPTLHSPVDGIVTNAREGTAGMIAIRDANGFSHEILHTHARHVVVGDPVVAGQLIGTMGNMGVKSRGVESGDHHVHYQLKDPAGNIIDPSAFWDQQGPINPNPAEPAYLGEHQQYLGSLGAIDLSAHRPRQRLMQGPKFDVSSGVPPVGRTSRDSIRTHQRLCPVSLLRLTIRLPLMTASEAGVLRLKQARRLLPISESHRRHKQAVRSASLPASQRRTIHFHRLSLDFPASPQRPATKTGRCACSVALIGAREGGSAPSLVVSALA